MANYNSLVLIGNLTRDVELRYTPKGTPVGQAGIAVNRHWTTETGEKKKEVMYVDFKVWGRSAETLAQYVKKGYNVMLIGRLALEQWDDKTTGQKRSKHMMQVESFQFLTNKRDDSGGEGYQPDPDARPNKKEWHRPDGKTPAQLAGDGPRDDWEDVPF